jgi:hypothetical protein
MKPKTTWFVVLICLLTACRSTPAVVNTPAVQASAAVPPVQTSLATESPVQASEAALPALPPPPQFEGGKLPLERDDWFAGSGLCVGCHVNMVDESGADVSVGPAWSASSMANAARDPYWQATVRSEILDAPQLKEVIEDQCATCHTPMPASAARFRGEKAALLDGGLLDPTHAAHALAMDGVSCNLCHQVEAGDLGAEQSFSGGYLIDPDLPMGERHSYGRFEVDASSAAIMAAASGFKPLPGDHLAQSEMCATCHNLYTPYLDENGQVAGEFPEQMPYSEWLHSDYKDTASCQSCHMPVAQGGVQLSVTGGPKRSPFSQHTFFGGNVFLGRIFQYFGEEMSVTSSSQNFASSVAGSVQLLQEHTATLSLHDLKLEGGKLLGEIKIESQTGHKLPASYPSRRAWLHITVKDAAGNVVFESGAASADGKIASNDQDDDAARFEPHYTLLSAPDQVQIYEAIMGDTQGKPTTRLLHGAQYLKDNRLLPVGFDKATAPPEIAVHGDAAQDADFTAGGDTLQLALDLGQAQAPFTIQVELLYQSIGYRWARNLADFDAAEITRFLNYYQSVPNWPTMISTTSSEVR